MIAPRLVAAVVLATAALLASSPAAADVTKAACVEANRSAQSLRRAGKLAEARKQLTLCSDATCPEIVRADCTTRIDEIVAAQPSIVFDAKDGAGRDLGAVAVTVDGTALTDKLDGTALPVDPGEHAFTFTTAGQPPVTQAFVIKENEKGRHERIVLGAPPPVAAPVAPAPLPVEDRGMGTRRVLGLAIGGIGVAGIAAGSVFGLLALGDAHRQSQDCQSATQCARVSDAKKDHDAATRDGAISTAAFIAGGALLVGGGVLFLVSGRTPERTTAGLTFVPSVGSGGAALLVRGAF